MSTISDVLIKTLESLNNNDFDKFKKYLARRGPIPRQKLEEATVDDTVDMMVQAYCESNCGSVVSDILRKMGFNQLALNLEKGLQSESGTLELPEQLKQIKEQMDKMQAMQEKTYRELENQKAMLEKIRAQTHKKLSPLRVVLLGKTGSGKSASANTILGRKAFKEELSLESVTTTCSNQHTVVDGREITVIDTPGLFDTEKPTEELKGELEKCVEMSVPGPLAFLLVMRLDVRFREEERNAVKLIQENFGEGALKYTIVLLTHGDVLEGTPVKDVLSDYTILSSLIESVGGGYHVFNNDSKNSTQVRELKEKIEAMVEKNGGTCYTNEMYKEAQRKIREKEKRRKAEEDRKKKQDELELKFERRMRKEVARNYAEEKRQRCEAEVKAAKEKRQNYENMEKAAEDNRQIIETYMTKAEENRQEYMKKAEAAEENRQKYKRKQKAAKETLTSIKKEFAEKQKRLKLEPKGKIFGSIGIPLSAAATVLTGGAAAEAAAAEAAAAEAEAEAAEAEAAAAEAAAAAAEAEAAAAEAGKEKEAAKAAAKQEQENAALAKEAAAKEQEKAAAAKENAKKAGKEVAKAEAAAEEATAAAEEAAAAVAVAAVAAAEAAAEAAKAAEGAGAAAAAAAAAVASAAAAVAAAAVAGAAGKAAAAGGAGAVIFNDKESEYDAY